MFSHSPQPSPLPDHKGGCCNWTRSRTLGIQPHNPQPSPRNGRGPSRFSGPAVCRTRPAAQDLLLPASGSPPPPTSPRSSPPSIPAPRPEPHLTSPSSPDPPGRIPSRVTPRAPPPARPCPRPPGLRAPRLTGHSPGPAPSQALSPPPCASGLPRWPSSHCPPSTLSDPPQPPSPCRNACCTKTLLTSTPATGFGWVGGAAIALFRGDSFLLMVEPLICKLVPQTTFTEDGKVTVVPSTPGVVLGPGCWK